MTTNFIDAGLAMPHRKYNKTAIFLALFLLLSCGRVAPLQAQQIDLALNIFFDAAADPNSGGTWEVVGRSTNSGIKDIAFYMTGIDGDNVSNAAPRGVVNGFFPAGMQLFVDDDPTFVEIGLVQIPLADGQSDQPLFYGIGTLENGSPNYPGAPVGSNSIGPELASLQAVSGVAWAKGDAFGDAAWDTAATLASGTFSPGQTPAFVSGLNSTPIGTVFTSVGTSSSPGSFSASDATTIDILTVRSNQADPFGDYNGDGFVDAADYTVWKDTQGQVVTAGTGADGNFSGLIDQGDYAVWRSLYGTTAAPLSLPSGEPIPEPAGKTLGIFTILVIGAVGSGIRMRARAGEKPA